MEFMLPKQVILYKMDSSKVMTLEEFLTLSDVKDGITAPSRIEELITLMQKEKDGEVKSADEATRQHSAITRVVAKTENTSCLGHFIKLGGLWHINGWLNDALSFAADSSGDFIDESITLQFSALEKLCVSNEMLISSGILDTIKNLCDHSSNIIKEKARKLLDRWKDLDILLVEKNVERVDAVCDTEEGEAMTRIDEDSSLLKVIDLGPQQTETSESFVNAGKDGEPDLKDSDCLQLAEAEQIKVDAACSQMTTPVSLSQINFDGEAIGDIVTTEAGISKVVTSGEGIVHIDDSKYLGMRNSLGVEKPGALENTNNGRVTEKLNSTTADLKNTKFTQSSNPQESEECSSVPDILMAEAEQTMPEAETQSKILCCKEGPIPVRNEFVEDKRKVLSENSSGMDDLARQRSSVGGSPDRTSPTLDSLPANATSEIVAGLNYSKASAIQNLARDTKSPVLAETRSDIDSDYGLMDALEVARRVAKAVEMDMVNDGLTENISHRSRQPGSPDSTNEIDSQSRNLSEETSSKSDSSPQPSTEKKAESSSSREIHSEPEKCMQGVDQPQSSAQEVQLDNNENTCEFDLNQDVPYDNAEFSVNFSQNMYEENGVLTIQNSSYLPSPVVSSSRSHVDDPQLAFGPSSITGTQKQGTLSIDLNLDKEGSNVATAPAKSMKFDFDLNMMSDVEDALPSSSRGFDRRSVSHPNGHPSSLPPSSLFPMQSTINIDLNEWPATHRISSHPHPFHVGMPSSQSVGVHPFFGTSSSQNAAHQPDTKPVISIMGARVEVNRNDYSDGASPLSNGKSENHSVESNVGAMGSYLGFGPMGSYGHPSHFTYNNTNTLAGPTMSFVSPMFRPGNTMTYMVDPRVGPLHQMVNPPSALPHVYSQAPFFMSMVGPPISLNGVLPSSTNFDLNLGFTNGGNRQDMASRQLFGEHLSPPDSQPASSFGKRKESETGWETYPYNMKHRYPPGSR